MAKYHITPNGPRVCSANIRDCQYAQAGETHFDNIEAAQAVYEQELTEKYGTLPKVSAIDSVARITYRKAAPTIEKIDDASYRIVQTYLNARKMIATKIKAFKASPEVQALNKDLNDAVRMTREIYQDVQTGIKKRESRMVAKYRASRMRAKSLVESSKNDYRKISDEVQFTKEAVSEDVQRAQNIMSSIPKKGKDRAQRFVDARRDAMVKVSGQAKQRAQAINTAARTKVHNTTTNAARYAIKQSAQAYVNAENTVKNNLSTMKEATVKNSSVNRMKNVIGEGKTRVKTATNMQKEILNVLRNGQQQTKLHPLTPENISGRLTLPQRQVEQYFSTMKEANTHRGDRVAEYRRPGEGRRRATVDA